MNHIVVLIEHNVGVQTAQSSLKREKIVGQRKDSDSMVQGPQHAGHVVDAGRGRLGHDQLFGQAL